MNRNIISLVVFFFALLSFTGEGQLFAQTAPDSNAVITAAPVPALPKPEAHSVIGMEFIKEKTEHSPDSTFFNILKITNNNGSAIQGVVRVSVPQGWKVISAEETSVNINAGQTEYIPIRVSLDRRASGGTSYIINATLISNRPLFSDKNQTSISKACYITIPQKRQWDVYPLQRSVYFDRYSPYSPLQLKMINKGNGSEVVKLEFEIGSSLQMVGAFGNRHFTSIELKPHSDTVISFPIKYLPVNEAELWNRDFKKLAVRITATVDTIIKKTTVNFKYLESNYYNLLYGKVTPLNIEVQLQNLLSNVSPRVMVSAYGMILLKNDDVIDYNARLNNIPFSGYDKFNAGDYFWTRSRMWAGYTSDKWALKVGDNVGAFGSGLLSAWGRGIGGKYKINRNHTIGGAFAAALGTPIYSGTIFHETLLRNAINLRSALTAIVDDYNKLNTYSASLQTNYSFLPGHSLSLLVAGTMTQHNYNDSTFLDFNGNPIKTNDPGATRYGFATQLGYNLSHKKINGALNALWASKDFSQYYSGKLTLNGNVQYFMNKKYSLLGSSGIYLQDPRSYNRGILYPENKYLAGTHRIELAGRMTNKLTLFTGPVLEHFSYTALKINQITGDSTFARFKTISPKLSMRCSYKNNVSGFINPYTMVGYTFVTSADDSSLTLPTTFIPKNAFFNAKAGLNVIQSNWGVNLFYYIGPYSLSAQSDYYYFGRYSKSIRIMPFFQKYYFNKKVLLSSYNSYYYEALSNNERIALNARIKFFLDYDWTFYVDNNLFFSSRISSDGEKVYGRNYFLSIGVKKSFDIPQPRVKYYDLKIICYKDINGNQIKDENEQGISDVVISIDRQAQNDSITKKSIRHPGQFSPAEMITDNFGQVIYYHIPQGDFNIGIYPLQNLKDVFILNGQKQNVTISRDTTYYIPFVQSYRVMGKIIINRDEYSSYGAVSLASIRITATDSIGNSFPALTTFDGTYTLYVPQAGEYKVTINNVFSSEQFTLQESEYTVSFDGAKEFSVNFIFNEKKRKVNMNGSSGSLGLPGSLGGSTSFSDTSKSKLPGGVNYIVSGKDTIKGVTMATDTIIGPKSASTTDAGAVGIQGQPEKQTYTIPVGPGISYRIQLVSTSTRIPKSQFAAKFPGVSSIIEYSDGGIYKYTSGNVSTIDAAKKLKTELRAKGYKEAFLVPFYKGTRVKY